MGLSRVLVREDDNGEKTYYVYGLGLIGEESGGEFRAYHYDLRGSMITLSGFLGEVRDRFWYGPYGELLRHVGESQTPFLYNGRDGVMTDPNGLYYMRARYYSPEIKRFVSKDRRASDIFDPLSLNPYIFAADNPVIFIDPLGRDWISVIAGVAGFAAGVIALGAGLAGAPAVVVLGATMVGVVASSVSLVYTEYQRQKSNQPMDTAYILTQISNALGIIPGLGFLSKAGSVMGKVGFLSKVGGVMGKVGNMIENLTTFTPEGRVLPLLYSTKSLEIQGAMTTYDFALTLEKSLKPMSSFK
ncbi:RHS repeat-associated core domain-containing protein [Brockia lithotrophica]|uniref:RHS repeat-associated protein n=1 Tax=Brockia lithotrophica TaxID=933949 RepID=A0A660KX65_9BACL|nr:RHS repeat-associated core domain-containing protein [Brockia lithotrophica]RKQ84579.1 RHS repeat-associated protein [Brockia lithotrophica]